MSQPVRPGQQWPPRPGQAGPAAPGVHQSAAPAWSQTTPPAWNRPPAQAWAPAPQPAPAQQPNGTPFTPRTPSPRPNPTGGRILGLIVGGVILVGGIAAIGMLATSSSGRDEYRPTSRTTSVRPTPPAQSTWQPPTTQPTRSSTWKDTPIQTSTPSPQTTTTKSSPKPKQTQKPKRSNPLPKVKFGKLPKAKGTGAWRYAQRAKVYQAAFPTMRGCPKPSVPRNYSKLKKQSSAQLRCIQKAWRPVMARYGYQSHTVPHTFFSGSSVMTPCGRWSNDALYCSSGRGRIYIGKKLGNTYDPLRVVATINHEYGHHIQARSGIWQLYALSQTKEITRRSELQATCFGMGMLRRDKAYRLTSQTYNQVVFNLTNILVDGIHGSPASNKYWGLRAFYGKKAGTCNTWVVSKGYVK